MPTSASSWSPLVNLFVARRGGVPGEILAHGAKLQVPPGLRVRAAQGESAANGARESLGRSIVEDEPGAIPRRASFVSDRVRETSGAAADGNGGVAPRVHLGEAARLVARRHQEQIAAGDDEVRETLVVADSQAHAV